MDDKPVVVRSSRLAERALALTAATFVLLTPPILTIFDVPVLVFGVPLLHVYCFAAWLGAIVAGRWLAARMAPGRARSAVDASHDA